MASAKFTRAQVLNIRDMLGQGVSAAEIMRRYREFGVYCSVETIRRIGRRETWTELLDDKEIEGKLAIPLPPLSREEQMVLDAGALRLMAVQKQHDQEKMLEELAGMAEGKPAPARVPAHAADTREEVPATVPDLTDIQNCEYWKCPGKLLCVGIEDKLCALHPEFKGA